MKKCNTCNVDKSFDEFPKDKNRKDGCRNRCKKCENLKRRKTDVIPQAKEGNKICYNCRCEKDLKEFNIRKVNGEYKAFSYCKVCEREKDNNRYSHKCTICNKEYKSGRKGSIYCKPCFDKNIAKTHSTFGKVDISGKNNPMYGVIRRGKDHPSYNPNISDEERMLKRNTEEYKKWRIDVYERDNYECKCCGYNKGGILVAHHLNSYHWDKDNRTELSNGVTLCKYCHIKFHKIYGFKDNTGKQFEEFKALYSLFKS